MTIGISMYPRRQKLRGKQRMFYNDVLQTLLNKLPPPPKTLQELGEERMRNYLQHDHFEIPDEVKDLKPGVSYTVSATVRPAPYENSFSISEIGKFKEVK